MDATCFLNNPEDKIHRVSEMRTHFGLVNDYHKFLPNPAALHRFLRKTVTWKWKQEQGKVLTVDATPLGVGKILSHRFGEIARLVRFVSKSLNSAEENFSQTDLEALDIIHGVVKSALISTSLHHRDKSSYFIGYL